MALFAPNPQSRIQRVIALVRERGTATVDDIHPLMPDCTRQQVMKALTNAANEQGWLDCSGHEPKRGEGVGQGAVAATYTARAERRDIPARKRYTRRLRNPVRVASVFHLASLPQCNLF